LAGKEGIEMMNETTRDNIIGPIKSRIMGIRGRFVDDLIKEAFINYNITQVVNAACGVDTVAWRIKFPDNVTYFEMDFPEILEWKQSILKNEKPLCKYKSVSVDLRSPDWSYKLIDAGFDRNQKTLWITAGFLPYLPEKSVHEFLSKINELSSEGSLYGCDISACGSIDNPIYQKFLKYLETKGCPIQFIPPNPRELFAQHGFTKCLHQITFQEKAKIYGIEVVSQDFEDYKKELDENSLLLVLQK